MRPTVLIVDDHPGFRQSAGALLEAEGFAVIAEAADGDEAIAGRLFVTERTVEAHVKQILLKLGLDLNPASHRRVLAVLAYLRGEGLEH